MEESPVSAVKLNLGCGAKLWQGFVNVDLANNWTDIPPDVVADVTGPLPFETGYADEVHAYHLLEHIDRWAVKDCLIEWIRVLKPGGLLVLEMPCFDKIVAILAHAMLDRAPYDTRMTMWGLYGDPKYKSHAMMHRWCYSVGELRKLLQDVGLTEITVSEPQTHQPKRDMRVTSTKPWQ